MIYDLHDMQEPTLDFRTRISKADPDIRCLIIAWHYSAESTDPSGYTTSYTKIFQYQFAYWLPIRGVNNFLVWSNNVYSSSCLFSCKKLLSVLLKLWNFKSRDLFTILSKIFLKLQKMIICEYWNIDDLKKIASYTNLYLLK